MTTSDLVARLYLINPNEAGRWTFEKNQDRLRRGKTLPKVPSPDGYETDTSDNQYQEGTQSPEEHEPGISLDCLEFTFGNEPKTNHGFVFGRDPKCDVVLAPQLMRVSNYHFALMFEKGSEDTDQYRLVVRDLNSSSGPLPCTAVWVVSLVETSVGSSLGIKRPSCHA